MRRRLPPLKQLVAFEAVARHRSFSLAADELCLTNGAVSRQIKTLEERLGLPLFDRSGTGVELTAAGRRLLPSVLAAFEQLEMTTRDLCPEKRDRALVVGCPPTLAFFWLVPLLSCFLADCGDIQVDVRTSDSPLSSLRDDLDIVIDFDADREAGACISHKLIEQRHGPVCHPDLISSGKLRSIQCLRELTLLHSDNHSGSWHRWCQTVALSDLPTADGPRFTHGYLMLQAVSLKFGVGIAAQSWVAEDLRCKRLAAPFGFVPSGEHYRIYYLPEKARSSKVRTFCDWLLSNAPLMSQSRESSEPNRDLPSHAAASKAIALSAVSAA